MTTKTVGRPVKEIKRVMKRVPENFSKEAEKMARLSGMKLTDFLEEAVRYMKLKPLKQMEQNYAAEMYEAQMASMERDMLADRDCRGSE